MWRKLRRYGALALKSGGQLLPGTPANREHFEWLAAVIRKAAGHASVMQVQSLDDLSGERLQQMFIESRTRDYEAITSELKKLGTRADRNRGTVARLRRRFREVSAIDFFNSPMRSRVESLLARAEEAELGHPRPQRTVIKGLKNTYQNRVWMTRPRPGIDRVSSAWLIRGFIDNKAKFIFGNEPGRHPAAIPFDMFQTKGFGHRGEDCTFETLCKEFAITDRKIRTIAQVIHDADLEDEKFGRFEGIGLDRTLIGWAKQGVNDEELLRRGMEMIEGLYRSLA